MIVEENCAYEVAEFKVSSENLLTVLVGKWPDSTLAGKPIETIELIFKLDAWTETLHSEFSDMILSHPDWSGPPNTNTSIVFHWPSKIWVDTKDLTAAKVDKWQAIKSARTELLYAPLVTDIGEFDADLRSQKSITDAIMLLQTLTSLNQPASVDFTLRDNTTVNLSLLQITQVGLALGRRTQAIYAQAKTKRMEIEAAVDIAQLEAICW